MGDASDRHLMAILAADLVGYSALMARDQGAALEILRRLRNDSLEPRIRAAGGHVFKRLGDGWLAGFPSVMAAVTCARDVQHELHSDPDIALRIGLHLGEVIREEDDYFGDGINIAVRLEGLADPGGIAMSAEAHRQIATAFSDRFHACGPRRLKNIPVPVEVFSWPAPLPAGPGAQSGPATLFVAPFGGAAEGADLSEDLAASLNRQTGVDLLSDETRARFRLSGTLRNAAGKSRLTVHLTDTRTGHDLWRGRMEEGQGDLFDRLDRLVVRTSAEFRYKLQAYEARELASRDYAQMTVAELLNAASGMFQTPDEACWRGAAVPLRRALEREPDNFMANAMLAASLLTGLSVGWREDAPEDVNAALRSSAAAIAAAPTSDFSVFSRGYVMFKTGDLAEARRLGERAIEINAGYTNSFYLLGLTAAMTGDTVTARRCAEVALETDVQHPMRHLYEITCGYAEFSAGCYDAAAEAFRRSAIVAPRSGQSALGLLCALKFAGDRDGVARAAERLFGAFPDFEPDAAAIMPFQDPARREQIRDLLRSIGSESG